MSGSAHPTRRILFLAPEPFYRLRGICLAQKECLEMLSGLGREVDVLTFPFGEDVRIPNVRILRLSRPPGVRDVPIGPSYRKMLMDVLILGRMVSLLRRGSYPVVHACEDAVFPAALLKPFFGFRLLYDMDDVLSLRLERSGFVRSRLLLRMIAGLERWMIRSSDIVLTNSTETTEYARRFLPEARVVFHDHAPPVSPVLATGRLTGGERSAFRAGRRLNGEKVILYSGNLEPYQGVDLLLESLPEVFAEVPGACCVIIGGEPDQVERLERRARVLGIGSSVRLLGKKPLEWAFRCMRAADVLVSPMTEEKAVPMKLYAYLSAGRPIVATDLPNHTELLDGDTAVLVAPGAVSLADGLKRVLRDGELRKRMTENIRRRRQDIPGPDSVLEALKKAYELLDRA